MLKNTLLRVKVAAIALMLLIHTLETNATWGNFDPTFGFAGVAFDQVTGHVPHSVAIQPDGKILVAGHRTTPLSGDRFFLRRYLANGSLDTAFGTNGAAIGPETNSLTTDYRGDAIVVQANGKIAVAGWANGYHAVWQFNSSGKQDKTFGENGLQVLTSYPVVCVGYSHTNSGYPRMNSGYPEMNIQGGKLLLSLGKKAGVDTCRVALLRLTSIGTFDTHFGSAGESLTSISGGPRGFGTVVETDGKITIGGVRFDAVGSKGLERKLANGQDDLTFSPPTINSFGIISPGLVKMTNGKYAMRWGNTWASSVTLMLDKFSSAGVFEAGLWPYNRVPAPGCPEIFTNQNDGKLIVQYLGLLFRANNEIDGSSVEINDCSNLGGVTDFARAAIQPDDKMVVAGVYNNHVMLTRHLPN